MHAVGKIIMDCYSFEALVSAACSQTLLGTFTVGTKKVAFAYSSFEVVKRTLSIDIALVDYAT